MSTAPTKPLVIEFFGLSGAGKTTLARACVERLRGIHPFVYSKPDVWNKTPWRGFLPRVRTIIQEWPTAWRTMPLDFRNPSLPRHPGEADVIYRLRAAVNAPCYMVAIKRIADTNPNSIMVLDGWLVMNRIWGPCRREECQVRKTTRLLTYFESQFNFILVNLNVDSEEAARRAYARGQDRRAGRLDGWSRFDDLEQRDTAAYHKTREVCLQCLRDRYVTAGGRMYELDARSPIEENVEAVISDIVLPHIESLSMQQSSEAVGRQPGGRKVAVHGVMNERQS